MPTLMQLQGHGVGYIPRPGRAASIAFYGLRGVGGAITMHPIVTIAGLVLGGYLAHKKIKPLAFLSFKRLKHGTGARIWGSGRASYSRAKALSGRRRRRR